MRRRRGYVNSAAAVVASSQRHVLAEGSGGEWTTTATGLRRRALVGGPRLQMGNDGAVVELGGPV